MIRATALPALLLLTAGSAAAQTGAAAVAMPQVSAPDRSTSVGAPSDVPSAALSARPPRGRGDLVSTGAPIGEGRRTAESSPDVSTRAQGRAVATSAVGGRDRCDAPAAADAELCRGRIEARSGEYGKPAATPVTAEGRLLLLTQTQPAVMTTEVARRRLGGTSQDVDFLAGAAAGQLAAAISQTNPKADVVPNGGSPTAAPNATVLNPAAAAVITPR